MDKKIRFSITDLAPNIGYLLEQEKLSPKGKYLVKEKQKHKVTLQEKG